MRDRILTISIAVIVGSFVGGAGWFIIAREVRPEHLVDGQPLRYWIKGLDGDDGAWRSAAVKAIPQFGTAAIDPTTAMLDKDRSQDSASAVLAAIGAPAIPAIVCTIQSGSPAQQFGALKALDQMTAAPPPAPATIALLAERLRGDDDTIAPLAESYLLRVGPTQEASDIAAGIVENGNTTQKIRAMKVMLAGKKEDPAVIRALDHALRDRSDAYTAGAVFNIIAAMRPPPIELAGGVIVCADILHGQEKIDESLQRILATMAKSAIPALRQVTTQPFLGERLNAVEALRSLAIVQGEPLAEDALAEFVDDKNETVCLRAAQALGDHYWNDEEFVVARLRSSHASMRLLAIQKLGKLRVPTSGSEITKCLRAAASDPDADVRAAARGMVPMPSP